MVGNWRWKFAQFAERIWWRNYLRNKEVNSYLDWKRSYWKNLLSQTLPFMQLPNGASILDVGCGPAGIYMALDEYRVEAFDPLIEQYEADLPHFRKSFYPGVQFYKAGLEDFESRKTFDAVFCMNAINHVHDIAKSFDRLITFGHPGTFFVITIDAHNYNLLKRLFSLLPGDILHPHQYTLDEYLTMLTQRNCKIISSQCLKHDTIFDHYLVIAQKD